MSTGHLAMTEKNLSSPAEYRELLMLLDISQSEASAILGVNERTSRRWASGDRPFSGPPQHFLRFLARSKISPAEAMRILAVGPFSDVPEKPNSRREYNRKYQRARRARINAAQPPH